MASQQDKLQLKKGGGSKNKPLTLDFKAIKGAALTLRAINHTLRKKIVKLLKDHGKLSVSEIYKKLRIEQSVASQHLAILRDAGIVQTEREGKFIYYSLNTDRLAEIAEYAESLA